MPKTTIKKSKIADIQYKQLERFVEIVERGGLADAAKNLGITQQALGMSLAKLESMVGTTLVNRSRGNQTSATEYGEVFLLYARSQINGMEEAVHHMHALMGARAGKVEIGVGETCDVELIAQVLLTFHQQRPDVEINIIEDYSEALLNQLTEGRIDFLCGSVSASNTAPRGIVEEQLYSLQDIIVAREKHPVMKLKRPKLKDLQGYTWLVPRRRPSDWHVIRNAFITEGLEAPAHVIRSDAPEVGTQLMLSSDFLFMTSPAMAGRSYDANHRPILHKVNIDRPTVTRHASLVSMSGRKLNPAAEVLMDEIRRSALELHGS
ncbi:MAG: DNA-binding transcriptional LysR family regulator [Glaciecola sp.]|jgi:DNA-binding transcriptional LysR family regulator|uniref:LysR family transcriptional regulator n=1 Tax=Congregibacter sp. TaxID=2744308 RepID=UPI0039E68E62